MVERTILEAIQSKGSLTLAVPFPLAWPRAYPPQFPIMPIWPWQLGLRTIAKVLAPALACLTQWDTASSPVSWVSASALCLHPSSVELSKWSPGPGVSRSTWITSVSGFFHICWLVGSRRKHFLRSAPWTPLFQRERGPGLALVPHLSLTLPARTEPASPSNSASCAVVGSTRHLSYLTLYNDLFELNSLTPSKLIGRPRKWIETLSEFGNERL